MQVEIIVTSRKGNSSRGRMEGRNPLILMCSILPFSVKSKQYTKLN